MSDRKHHAPTALKEISAAAEAIQPGITDQYRGLGTFTKIVALTKFVASNKQPTPATPLAITLPRPTPAATPKPAAHINAAQLAQVAKVLGVRETDFASLETKLFQNHLRIP